MQRTLTTNKTSQINLAFYDRHSLAIIKSYIIFFVFTLIIATNPYHSASAITIAQYVAMQHEAEHQAVLNLVPENAVDRKVVQSGAWSDPGTWSGGKLPTDGENIYVPQDLSLFVDVVSDVSLGTVRVDGAIKFATNKNVKIKLDTLVVTESGSFEIGSETQRVSANYTVEVLITNKGPINRNWDPKNISRGVILQGKTRIFGADKSPFHQLSVNPDLGASQISLEGAPTGWKVGDIIVVTATRFLRKQGNPQNLTQDEVRRINAISGSSITLGQVGDASVVEPLAYSHVPKIPSMPVYVANLTRNVVFAGENGASVPVSQRGHFMVMHAPDAIIKGAGFNYLGRTDKSKPIDDYKLDRQGTRLKDGSGNYLALANNNPRGRYSVHFHHTGVKDINASPAICSGNAVFSGAGWGFVNHTSNVIMENNASYDVYGSHYVSEDGNELGMFKHNIAIKATGRPTYIKFGQNNHDVGHTGHGFWLESRNLMMEDNVISGVNKAGVVYWHRNFIPGTDLHIPKENLLTPYKDIVKNYPTLFYERVPITYEKNSTVLASGGALDVIKAFHDQGHDGRNVIESFKGYSVESGIGLQYTEKYTLKDVEIYADPFTRPWHKGITILPQVKDIVFTNLKINNFIHPVVTDTRVFGKTNQTDVTLVNTLVNDRPINASDFHKPANAVINNYDADIHHFINLPAQRLSSSSVSALKFTPSSTMSFNFPRSFNMNYKVIGTKTDSLGQAAFESTWLDKQLIGSVKKGYYTDTDGSKYVLLTEPISDRLTGATINITTKLKLLNKFNEMQVNLGPLP